MSVFRRSLLSSFALLTLVWAISLFQAPALSASQDTERSSHLELLQQATGSSSSSESVGSFSSHIDSILTTTPEPERTVIDQIYPETPAQKPAESLAGTGLSTLKTPSSNPLGQKELGKSPLTGEEQNLNDPLDQRMKMDEESYQAQLMKEAEKRRQEEETNQTPARSVPSQQQTPLTGKNPKSSKILAPSLANNPFYFSAETRENFEQNKPIIISRLVQIGYTRSEAENLVMGATSPEEVILSLMQNEDFEYGNALEFVS